jgi:large subunit ribosomal protein L19
MSNSVLIKSVTESYIRTDLPTFNVGDNISVTYIIDGDRTQTFKGIVLAIKGSGVGKTFTLRKIGSDSIGVEKIMPINSPVIKSIVVNKQGSVRKAKAYYMRDRIGKLAMKIKDKVQNPTNLNEVVEVTSEVEQ